MQSPLAPVVSLSILLVVACADSVPERAGRLGRGPALAELSQAQQVEFVQSSCDVVITPGGGFEESDFTRTYLCDISAPGLWHLDPRGTYGQIFWNSSACGGEVTDGCLDVISYEICEAQCDIDPGLFLMTTARGMASTCGGDNWADTAAADGCATDVVCSVLDQDFVGGPAQTYPFVGGPGRSLMLRSRAYTAEGVCPGSDATYSIEGEVHLRLTNCDPDPVTGLCTLTQNFEVRVSHLAYESVPSFDTLPVEDPVAGFITGYGDTLVEFEVIAVDADGLPRADVEVTASAPGEGWVETRVRTDDEGVALFQYLAESPMGTALSGDVEDTELTFTFTDDTATSPPITIEVVNNYRRLLEIYFERVPSGTGCNDDPDTVEEICMSILPGVANNIVHGANETACGGYQSTVLNLLDRLRLATPDGTNEAIDAQWVLNGLDYGPVAILHQGHQAVAVWHTDTSTSGLRVWSQGFVFDPWITQRPAVYPAVEWGAVKFMDGSTQYFGYPTNAMPYPDQIASLSFDYDPFISLTIESPARLLIEADGQRYGYVDDAWSEGTLPVYTYLLFEEGDGTLGTFAELLPSDAPAQLTLFAVDTGDVTLTLYPHDGRSAFRYPPVAVERGDRLVLSLEGQSAPSMTLNDEVTVEVLPALHVVAGPSSLPLPELSPQTTTLTVRNGGAVATDVIPSATGPEGLAVRFSEAQFSLQPQEVRALDVTVSPVQGLTEGESTLQLELGSSEVSVAGARTWVRVIHDMSPPSEPRVSVRTVAGESTLRVSYFADDPHTRIAAWAYAVAGEDDALTAPSRVDWTPSTSRDGVVLDGLVEVGDRVRVLARATNGAGLASPVGASEVVVVGAAPPRDPENGPPMAEGSDNGGGGCGCEVSTLPGRSPLNGVWLALLVFGLASRRIDTLFSVKRILR